MNEPHGHDHIDNTDTAGASAAPPPIVDTGAPPQIVDSAPPMRPTPMVYPPAPEANTATSTPVHPDAAPTPPPLAPIAESPAPPHVAIPPEAPAPQPAAAPQPFTAREPTPAGSHVATPPPTQRKNWRKRIEGGTKIAGARFKEQADKAKEQILATDAGSRAAEWGQGKAAAADDRLDTFAETDAGKKVSNATRKFGKVMSKVPGVTATMDSISIRNGVDVLTQAVQENPKDPVRLLHLVMALQRTDRDMAAVRAAKALYKPSTLVTRTIMRKSAAMGSDDMAMQEKLMRAAFKRAAAIKQAQPANADNLHLLARIYLAQEHADMARKLARLALAAGPTHAGDVYVTLAHVENLDGHVEAVTQYANLAVKHGSSLGYAIFAEQAMARDMSAADRIREYEHYADHVVDTDEERYYGVPLDPASMDVTRRLLRKHRDKVTDLKDLALEKANDWRDTDDPDLMPAATVAAVPASWYPDPMGRFQYRYWDGNSWTETVATDGEQHADPL